jgi:hypothetical protein
MAEDELFCEWLAKTANVRLAFDTRAKTLLDVSTSRQTGISKLQIFRLDFCTALRHHAAKSREMVTSGVGRGNIGGGVGLS